MRKTEYIVQIFTKDYGWCLECVCGDNYNNASKAYFKRTIENPNNKYRIRTIRDIDCWWNDPFLAN